jgi:hypothetical protein
MHWCELAIQQLGHTEPITASEFFDDGNEVIPTWYQPLLFRARVYTASQVVPVLILTPRPFIVAENHEEGGVGVRGYHGSIQLSGAYATRQTSRRIRKGRGRCVEPEALTRQARPQLVHWRSQ